MNRILIEYEKHLKTKESSNINSKLYAINQFISFLNDKGLDNLNISLNIAEQYKVCLSTEKFGDHYYHRGTINNKLAYLREFYLYLQKQNLVIANPFFEVKKVKTGDHLPKNILTDDEVELLFSHIKLEDENDIIFFVSCEILYSCGLRVSEVADLKVKNIDFERGVIKIMDAKRHKERLVPVSEYCQSLIREYISHIRLFIVDSSSLYLFPQSEGVTTFRCFMNRRLKSVVSRCGIKKNLTSHCFRHSMATAMLKNGAGIRQVQLLLGHARIKSTEVYTRVAKDDLKEVVKSKHPRERLFMTNTSNKK